LNRRVAIIAVTVAAAAVVIALVALLSGCGGRGTKTRPATLSPRLPHDFFGLVSEDAFTGAPAYRQRALADQAGLGVGLVRQSFNWSRIETAPGRFDFSLYDGFVGDAARAGMEVMPIVEKAPRFRAAAPPNALPDGTFQPRRFGDFGRFMATLAGRYGAMGSFWSSHPDLPRRPIRYWQIWNEPNLPAYWNHPDPSAYARLLKAGAQGLKRADPRAVVVAAGIPDSRQGIPFEQFINGMYKAGAASAFDVLAVHPYARDEAGVIAAVQKARDLAGSHGDDAPIWVTELGWASGGPPSPFTLGKFGQTLRIRRALRALVRRRLALGIRGVVYYNWRDARPYPPYYHDFWGLHTGLHDLRGRPKPALGAFRRTVRGLLRRYGGTARHGAWPARPRAARATRRRRSRG
jgi:hypothetical protein